MPMLVCVQRSADAPLLCHGSTSIGFGCYAAGCSFAR